MREAKKALLTACKIIYITVAIVSDAKDNCGVCTQPVRVTEKGVEFDVCTQWFRIKCKKKFNGTLRSLKK